MKILRSNPLINSLFDEIVEATSRGSNCYPCGFYKVAIKGSGSPQVCSLLEYNFIFDIKLEIAVSLLVASEFVQSGNSLFLFLCEVLRDLALRSCTVW